MIYHTQVEHANYYTTDAVSINKQFQHRLVECFYNEG